MITKKLSEISLKISSGLTPLRSNPIFWNEGNIPWLKTEQLSLKYIYDTNEYITEAALEKTSIRVYPKDTLALAMYGEGKTRGNVAIMKKPMATNQACCNIELNKDLVDHEYVYYFLKNQYKEIRDLASGVRKNLNTNDIKNFEIRFPESVEKQKSLSKVLKNLDDKIELNNLIKSKILTFSKLAYDFWFIQLNYPSLLQKEVVYNKSLKREIPVDWQVKSLWDIANYINGLPMQKYRPNNNIDFLPVVKIREMNNGINADTEKASKGIPSSAVIENGDILFSWSASLDVKIWTGGKAALNQHIFKVLPKEYYPKSFVYFELLNYLNHFKMIADLRKTTMGHITLDHLKQSKILIPPSELLLKFENYIGSNFELIVSLDEESEKLIKLRDWLLPMLMNGQISIRDAEEIAKTFE